MAIIKQNLIGVLPSQKAKLENLREDIEAKISFGDSPVEALELLHRLALWLEDVTVVQVVKS